MDVATYAADARTMTLPIVSPFGGHVYHDWNYLLSQIGILHLDQFIALLFRVGGFMSMGVCQFFGWWLIWLMSKKQEELQ